MLSYLAMADTEEHNEICNRITEVLDKFAPTPRWHIDTLVAMFRLAGKSVSEVGFNVVMRLRWLHDVLRYFEHSSSFF